MRKIQMSESAGHIMIQYVGEAAIVETLNTRLSDEMTIQAWSDEISAAIDKLQSQKRVILSFRNVKFMSSSALRALISFKQKTDKKKIALFLCNINPTNMEIFKITKLDTIFRITPTEVEAQRAIVGSKY
jgi:anti-anti-sigma factor